MSDGASEANREARKVDDVESAAYLLNKALLATGDRMFHAVHPQAVEYANEELKEAGYKLVKI